MATIDVYLERGTKKVFACATDWPGWCRSGRDEGSAMAALLESAPRYKRALTRRGVRFAAPRDTAELKVTGRHKGNATTDFGAPAVATSADAKAVGPADLRKLAKVLEASWAELDGAVASARGKTLTKGPRGGGRSRDDIVRHVVDAEAAYLGGLGWKGPAGPPADLATHRKTVLEGLAASARGDIPARGPRGGERWKPRFFVRRAAWHALDHAWEIEDRSRPAAAS